MAVVTAAITEAIPRHVHAISDGNTSAPAFASAGGGRRGPIKNLFITLDLTSLNIIECSLRGKSCAF